MQGPARGANFMLLDARLRTFTSLAPLHAICTICYASRHLYALHERARSAFHDLMAHNTRAHAADMLVTRGKVYMIVLVCTQKCAAGGGKRGYRIKQ